jgi:23S rRNA pseudouridine2605 synthase
MKERLQKYLSARGIASRREAEKLIAEGFVQVNGLPVPPSGMLVDPFIDAVCVKGIPVGNKGARIYYALNKPKGYTSTVCDRYAEKRVVELVPPIPAVYPVGRLDRDTEGLIILTNDGELTQHLTHPSFEHEKEYSIQARWREEVTDSEGKERLMSLAGGIELDDGMTLPANITIKSCHMRKVCFSLVLREGRKRQVRRMCQALGLHVESLIRVRIGKLTLGGIAPGSYRLVTIEDII